MIEELNPVQDTMAFIMLGTYGLDAKTREIAVDRLMEVENHKALQLVYYNTKYPETTQQIKDFLKTKGIELDI
ncbi:hypothetical protein HZC07_00495 [Candidatus Micrarchaeota archaeon]|nr:hypothetical protein [Candidatus Micrarchaeota archaeon]